jgi:DNA-directed RNA polymerase specialized sigma24 family protein
VPTPQDWQTITESYNQSRPEQTAEITVEVLQQWLRTCIQALRQWDAPPSVTSLNSPVGSEQTTELQELVCDPQPTPLSQLDWQEQISQLHTVLVTALQAITATALTPKQAEAAQEIATILPLYYGQQLSQQAIAQQLGIRQDKVSRRLTRAREQLLLAIAQQIRDREQISLTSEVLENCSSVLDAWLYQHFAPDDHDWSVAERQGSELSTT